MDNTSRISSSLSVCGCTPDGSAVVLHKGCPFGICSGRQSGSECGSGLPQYTNIRNIRTHTVLTVKTFSTIFGVADKFDSPICKTRRSVVRLQTGESLLLCWIRGSFLDLQQYGLELAYGNQFASRTSRFGHLQPQVTSGPEPLFRTEVPDNRFGGPEIE